MRSVSRIIFFVAFFAAMLAIVTHPHRGIRQTAPLHVGLGISQGEAGMDNDWFMTQRSYPYTNIPRNSLSKIREGMGKRFSGRNSPRTVATGSSWTLAGPSNIGGRIECVAFDPTDLTIYAGAASGGVWKTTDLGSNWAQVFNESFSIGAVALEPGNPSVVYVGTGENTPSGVATYPGNGIWRSTDAGSSWTNIGLTNTGYTGRIAINPLNPSTIFVAALGYYRDVTNERGIYKSTNRGATWTQTLFVNDTTCGVDVMFDPTDTSRVFAMLWNRHRTPHYSVLTGPSSGLYFSSNAGSTWAPVTNGFPSNDPNLGRISMAFAPSNPAIVYALTQYGLGWGAIYKSTDHGTSWTETFDGTVTSESQVWYNNVITIDPTNSNNVWAGMTNLYRSTDGGVTFFIPPIGGSFHGDQHSIQYLPLPNTILVGNDGGIYLSGNNGSSFIKSLNLPITQFYAGIISPQNPNRLIGGTQDNNSLQTHTGVVDSWDYIYCCDGFYCLIDPTDSNRVYAEAQYGGLGYSTDGGSSFFDGTNGISITDRKNWETPIAINPINHNNLFTGTQRVYESFDGMQSWTPISPDLTYGNGGRVGTITTIAVSRQVPQAIYVGTDDGRVWVSTDYGSTWTDIAASLPLRWVTRLTVDPDSSNIAYVTLSGFYENEYGGHLYRTSDYGATWTNLSASLPDIPLNDVVMDSANRNHLFVATDLNVLFSTNLGFDWHILGSGLPEVSVHNLSLHQGSRTLAAFTHGRSAYTIPLPSAQFQVLNVPNRSRWNLVSNPLQTDDDSLRHLYPASVGSAYSYSGTYSTTVLIHPGHGYWLRFPDSPPAAEISGAALPPDTIPVTLGWNLVGSASGPITPSSVGSDPPGMVTSSFFEYDGHYSVSDSILPGHGYWVKVNQDGSLIMPSSPGGGAAKTVAHIVISPTSDMPPPPPEEFSGITQNIPAQFRLHQNFPNPFNPSTTIKYDVPVDSRVTVSIFDALGRLVSQLVDETVSAGEREARWDASGVASGIYFCRMQARGLTYPTRSFDEVRKLMVVK